MIIAHPTLMEKMPSSSIYQKAMMLKLAIESGLQRCMLSCAPFAVVLIDDKSPSLTTRFEPFRDARDSICLPLRSSMTMVMGNVHFSTFVICCLKRSGKQGWKADL